jgi:methyltransferase
MTVALAIVALVALERLVELAYAHRNTQRLLAEGAIESGREHYPLFILLHGAWLLTIAVVAVRSSPVTIHWWLIAAFALLQVVRGWIIATLGPFWTTRIITPRDAPLVRAGPYRFVRHPNYIVVALEIALLPLAFGQVTVAIVFTILNAAVLTVRLRDEERALALRQ